MDEDTRSYDGLTMMYVPEDEADDDAGVYVRLYEVIAMLRYEAILAEQSLAEAEQSLAEGEAVERLDDCLNSIADGLAEEAVRTVREVEDEGL